MKIVDVTAAQARQLGHASTSAVPRAMSIPTISTSASMVTPFSDDIVNSVFQPVVTVKANKNAYAFDATFEVCSVTR